MFFEEIRRLYGEGAPAMLKAVKRNQIKIGNQTNRKIFLIKCRQHQIIPKFLQINLSHIQIKSKFLNYTYQKNYNSFINKMINLLISDCIQDIKHLNQTYMNSITQAKSATSEEIVEQYITNEAPAINNNFEKTKAKQRRKIQKWLTKNKNNNEENQNGMGKEKWLNNQTKEIIPEYAQEILSLGPKFAINYNSKKIPVNDIIANIEQYIGEKSIEEKTDIRTKVCRTVKNHLTKPNKLTEEQRELNKKIKKTEMYLKDHTDILVLKADKSNQTVIMYKKDYEEKMETLLSDKNTYKEIKKDPTAIQQSRNNQLITKWKEELIIDLKTANKLKNRNTRPPRIYGLPKVHKQGTPLRPIVSCIQSPLYELEKYLGEILKNIVGKTEANIKDSWEFIKYIKNKSIPDNHSIISLDVISLYTNIPIQLALSVIKNKWNEIEPHTNLPKNEFYDAMKMCLTSSYFSYNEKFYEQTYGLPMGAPLSACVANIVLEDLENIKLGECDFNIPLYKRYVDDVITIVPSNKCENILNIFNSYHERIQFTIEKEENNQIEFLDIKLIHNNNELDYEWNTKKTWSGRYLNFKAELPLKYKKSVVAGLADRAIKLTQPKRRKEQIQKVKKALKSNNYPNALIEPIIKQSTYKAYHTTINKNKEKQINKEPKIPIPYIKGLTEKISHILKPYQLQIASTNQNNLKYLYSNTKSKIKKSKQTHVIYSIPCKNCEAKYIGQTRQYLENRIKAHQYSVKGENADKTALTKHAKEEKHQFNFDNVTILDKETNEKRRLIKEMIHIKQEKKAINDRQDIQNLSNLYNTILK